MKAEALLARKPDPTTHEVARALAGNLCRCTGYVKIIEAIQLVAAARRGTGLPASEEVGVGSRAPRYEGQLQVLGERPFVADLTAPGMLHGALRLADHPRALVKRIDIRAAAAAPGVVSVATWRDVPGERFCGLLTA